MKASWVSLIFLVCGHASGAQSAAPPAAVSSPAAPSVPGPAAVAPPATGTGTATASAAPAPAALGRLFFTPAERASLDEARRRPPAAVVAAQPEPKAAPPAPEYVTLNGVVRRSDGTTTIWLNNRTVDERRSVDGLEVRDSKRGRAAGSVTVHVPQSGRNVDLRVGQQLEVTSGRVQEGYKSAPRQGSAAPGAAAETAAAGTKPAPAPRRTTREREMLRELIREIDGPAADRAEPAPPAKG